MMELQMKLSDWKDKGIFFTFNEHQLFSVDQGQGEPLLLIHGFPTASWDWAKMWPKLVKNYRLLTLDMLGFGFSDKPRKHSYSIAEQADCIEHFLAEKGIANIHILSHDYGDTVAQELLARFQTNSFIPNPSLTLKSICFLNGGLFPETHQPLLIQKILMSPLGFMVGRLFNREKLKKNFNQIFGPTTLPTEEELTSFWTLISANGGKYVFHLLIRYMQERKENRERWVGALQKANIPLRLIDGVYDPISGQNMVDRYRALVPNPDVIELKNIGHFPLIESPNEVVNHYREFRLKQGD